MWLQATLRIGLTHHNTGRRCLESDPSVGPGRRLAAARDRSVTSYRSLPAKRPVTVSSVVLRVVGLTVAATPKGVMEVTTAGREGSATSAEVVLGVDTHLDLHVGL